jgi:hypothetical protein
MAIFPARHGKLEGLSEYDVRRPLTSTGTNLLGLVKHLSHAEARYDQGTAFWASHRSKIETAALAARPA